MPEDFENVLDFPHEDRTKEILIIDKDLGYYIEKRVIPPNDNLWAWDNDWAKDYDAWMLPEPYKE